MIVTIARHAPPLAGELVAEHLALLRARGGRRVLLLDATSTQASRQWAEECERRSVAPMPELRAVRGFGLPEELERLYPRFPDVVIDTDGGDGHECLSALIMANVAVVPLSPEQANGERHHALLARIDNARMFNPGLRVLFVAAGGECDPAALYQEVYHAVPAAPASSRNPSFGLAP